MQREEGLLKAVAEHEVEQTAWRRDQHGRRRLAQPLHVELHRSAAQNSMAREERPVVLDEGGALHLDLGGELARRREHDRVHTARQRARACR